MAKINDSMTFKVNDESKEKFIKYCRENGINPSQLQRDFIEAIPEKRVTINWSDEQIKLNETKSEIYK